MRRWKRWFLGLAVLLCLAAAGHAVQLYRTLGWIRYNHREAMDFVRKEWLAHPPAGGGENRTSYLLPSTFLVEVGEHRLFSGEPGVLVRVFRGRRLEFSAAYPLEQWRGRELPAGAGPACDRAQIFLNFAWSGLSSRLGGKQAYLDLVAPPQHPIALE